MKVRIPKEYSAFTPAQKERLKEYCSSIALEAARETTERDGRIMLDLYIKMVCWTLHEAFGYGEKRLNYFLANHSSLFRSQQKMVQNGTQVDFLNEQMAKIFKKNGFPQNFFDKMLGPVDNTEVTKND